MPAASGARHTTTSKILLEMTAGLVVIRIGVTPDLKEWSRLLGPLDTLMDPWLAGWCRGWDSVHNHCTVLFCTASSTCSLCLFPAPRFHCNQGRCSTARTPPPPVWGLHILDTLAFFPAITCSSNPSSLHARSRYSQSLPCPQAQCPPTLTLCQCPTPTNLSLTPPPPPHPHPHPRPAKPNTHLSACWCWVADHALQHVGGNNHRLATRPGQHKTRTAAAAAAAAEAAVVVASAAVVAANAIV